MANPRKRSLADRLHHGFVTGCMIFTATISVAILLKGWEYYMYIKPQRMALAAKLEQELLLEGAEFKASLVEESKA